METIDLNIHETQAEIVFNRPHILNAANCEMVEDLHSALDEIETCDGLRVVILAGRGRAFSTGIDLKALSGGEIRIGWFRRFEEAMRRIEMLQPVTICDLYTDYQAKALASPDHQAAMQRMRPRKSLAVLIGMPRGFQPAMPALVSAPRDVPARDRPPLVSAGTHLSCSTSRRYKNSGNPSETPTASTATHGSHHIRIRVMEVADIRRLSESFSVPAA